MNQLFNEMSNASNLYDEEEIDEMADKDSLIQI